MPKVKPFKGLRPPRELVEEIACRPYDVLSSEEARAEAGDNEKSLYHIIKPEIDFAPGTDEHDPRVYDRAVSNLKKFRDNGWLLQDAKPLYYLYAQTMDGRTQYGFVVGVAAEAYNTGHIKKHELTRREKEEDRMKHIDRTGANIEPVFLSFPDDDTLLAVIDSVKAGRPEYDFIADDGIGHTLWLIDDDTMIADITAAFNAIPDLYIADGHHRTAAAARVGVERRRQSPGDPEMEYDYIMAVCFPESHLKVMDYNRVVKDLNGLSDSEFLARVAEHFDVEEHGAEPYRPEALHTFALYLNGTWYKLTAHPDTYDDNDAIGVLDVKVSSDYILRDILGITDLRTDKRIDFVGGIRGLGELSRRIDSGEMRVALALHPVTMKQIMNVAQTGNIMPPKATWFEPKLRSGLVIHLLDEPAS